jgi:hypothetical protein
MKPVTRVRLDAGRRPGAAPRDARANALRSRFAQMLKGSGSGSGAGMPAVEQTLTWRDPSQPGSGRSAELNALIVRSLTMHMDDANPAVVDAPPLPLQTQMQTQPRFDSQPPPAPRVVAMRSRHELPALVRDLVQTIVHLSRGRAGHWRLTMALQPQVFEATWITLEACPGRLHVRFDSACAEARAKLDAARDDLWQHLTDTLSAASPVDVRVEVQAIAREAFDA